MTKAILFDLDGTLLPMDTAEFIMAYAQRLSYEVREHMEPERFAEAMWQAAEEVINNLDDQRTNETVLMEKFVELAGVDLATIWPVLDNFYETAFDELSSWTKPTPLAARIVDEAKEQGYEVVVATNPIFPKKAIEWRLKWAGLDYDDFAEVTVYENAYFTKPHVQYYEMICANIQIPAEQCIMVGNDMQEDMVASQLGMSTFLVEDYLIDRGSPQYVVQERGSLAQVLERLQSKTGVFGADF